MFLVHTKRLCTLFTCLIFLAACGDKNAKDQTDKNPENKPKLDLRVPVELATIERGIIESHVAAYANLETESDVAVYARTSDLVSKILVEEGDVVEKGELLLTLDNEEQRISLSKISSTLEKNQSEFKRQQHLKQRNLVSDKDFASAKNMYQQSELDKEKSQLDYDYTFVKAPISGTVTERLVNLGDKVKTNEQLFTLVDFTTIVARIFLPEENLSKIKVGQRAFISSQSFPDQVFEGEVKRISPVIDARSGTVKVTVSLTPQKILRPGMYVNVSLLVSQTPDAILIPKKALVYEDERTLVYKVIKGKARRVYIETKVADSHFVEPITGIKEGDQVVMAGQNSLKNNASVRDVNAPDESDIDTDTAESSSEEPISKKPVMQEGETKEAFRERMKAYVMGLSEEDRKAFIEKNKKQRAEKKANTEAGGSNL